MSFYIRVQPGKELKPFLGFFDGGFVNDRVACTLIHGNVRVGVGVSVSVSMSMSMSMR